MSQIQFLMLQFCSVLSFKCNNYLISVVFIFILKASIPFLYQIILLTPSKISHPNYFLFFIIYRFKRNMPKAVDIYVLQKKIGSGQFGDVFRGYSKVDGSDVAVKTIRRDKVKGKFTELLDNQIQVLKSCKNNNIIRLIDIKKTANNIYLILEFCNDGDLGAYLKQKKIIPEEQAVQYFVQILHAFQTLVKSKIMHRDFKLPNVLKHQGVIKIADFGFAKLLGTEDEQAQTILGSPLNMAPEVLDHQAYNNKADIWSIGVAFFQMIFGKVPFSAGNIIDLLKKIKKQPLIFPHPVHPLIEDVLKKMLVVDPMKRIQWNALFSHPITRMLQQQIQQSLNQSLLCKKDELPFNMSKFYIKTNKVIENTNDLVSKQQLNSYVKNVVQNKQTTKFEGTLIKRKAQRENKQNIIEMKTHKQIQEDIEDCTQLELNKKQQKQKNIKTNTAGILHHRNVYAFFGYLAEDLLQVSLNIYSECLAFLLVKKVVQSISSLMNNIKQRKVDGIVKWEEYESSQSYQNVIKFIRSEEDIFNNFYQKLSLKVLQKGTLSNFQQQMMISGKFTRQETNRRIYNNVLREYLNLIDLQSSGKRKTNQHLIKLLDGNDATQIFIKSFDFNNYYNKFNTMDDKEAQKRVKSLIQKFRAQLV